MSGLILKISGSVLIIFSSVAASRMVISKLYERVKFTEGLIAGFVCAEEHICGMLRPFEEAFSYAAEDAGSAKERFLAVSSAPGDIRERFSVAFENSKESRSIIQYASGICASDEVERRTSFALIRNRLEQQYEQAAEDYRRLCRLYRAAGLLGGFGLVILLL